MNIHEYQAKALLRSYGAPVSDGRVVLKADEAKTAAGELDGPLWVVKAQIHAGGRGKGSFKEADAGEKGGVRLAMEPSVGRAAPAWPLSQPAFAVCFCSSRAVPALAVSIRSCDIKLPLEANPP